MFRHHRNDTGNYGHSLWEKRKAVASWAAGLSATLIFIPVFVRSKDAFQDIGQACVNIYEQQYQIGLLLHRYYNKTNIAAVDISAISYFTEGRKLDLDGLADIQVARSKVNNY